MRRFPISLPNAVSCAIINFTPYIVLLTITEMGNIITVQVSYHYRFPFLCAHYHTVIGNCQARFIRKSVIRYYCQKGVAIMNELYKRIEALCVSNNKTITEMCREAAVPRGNLTDLKMGRQQGLSSKNLRKIAEYFGISVDFLLGADENVDSIVNDISQYEALLSVVLGDKDVPGDLKRIIEDEWPKEPMSALAALSTKAEESKKAPFDISEEAKKIARDYDKLSDHGKGAVKAILSYEEKAVSAYTQQEQDGTVLTFSKAKKSRVMIEINVYDQPAAAGLGNYLDEPPFHVEQYPADVIPPKADFGIVISGDSMEPKVHDGGTVFVQAAPTIDPGKIGIFVLNGKAYCKKLDVDRENRQIRLVSLNDKYEDIVVGEFDQLYTVGRVLGQWTPGRRQDFLGW